MRLLFLILFSSVLLGCTCNTQVVLPTSNKETPNSKAATKQRLFAGKLEHGEILCVGSKKNKIYALLLAYSDSMSYGMEVHSFTWVENKLVRSDRIVIDDKYMGEMWKWDVGSGTFYSWSTPFDGIEHRSIELTRITISGNAIISDALMGVDVVYRDHVLACHWSKSTGYSIAIGPRLYTDNKKGPSTEITLIHAEPDGMPLRKTTVGPLTYGTHGNSTSWYRGTATATKSESYFFMPGGSVWRWNHSNKNAEEIVVRHNFGLAANDEHLRYTEFANEPAFIFDNGKGICTLDEESGILVVTDDNYADRIEALSWVSAIAPLSPESPAVWAIAAWNLDNNSVVASTTVLNMNSESVTTRKLVSDKKMDINYGHQRWAVVLDNRGFLLEDNGTYFVIDNLE